LAGASVATGSLSFSRLRVDLVYRGAVCDRNAALKREYAIRRLNTADKRKLVNG